jgi:vitamin B12 transporter
MRMRVEINTAPRVLLALLLSLPAAAQPAAGPLAAAPAGSVEGWLAPCEGGALGEAELLLISGDSTLRSLASDAAGHFLVEGLAPGAYDLHIQVPGCEPSAFHVRVNPGQRTTVRTELARAEGLETTIEVVGRRLTQSEVRTASAEAVQVVELEQARQQTADLGEVLSRKAGHHR